MSKGELKSRVRFSTTLDKEIFAQLKKLANETMIPISKLVDIAISNLVQNGIHPTKND